MAALPYMQFYVADYLADTAHLSTLEHGAYMLLLMNYWQRGKPLPTSDERLSRICRLSMDEWLAIKDNILEFFIEKDGELVQKRVEIELAAVMEKSDQARNAGRISAAKRRLNGCSTAVHRTFNHAEADADTDADTEKKDTGNGSLELAASPQEATAIFHLKAILARHDPDYTVELDRKPRPPEVAELLRVAMREGPAMIGKLQGWEAAEKALDWLKGDDFMRQYASVWWLFDVKNGGKKARINLIEYSKKKHGSKNVNSSLGDGQPFPAGRTFG
jgi:uncharacterized protein YdaU (DUF1376 family)